MELKTFNAVNVSSKFAICGLPIRADSYKTCSFGCRYCFAENREIMKYGKTIQVGSVNSLESRLNRIFNLNKVDKTNMLDSLISQMITWHWGGMSDPFQPCEQTYHITKQLVDITNKYGISVLFSTKSNTVYNTDIRPDIHAFQLSVSNVSNLKNIEPNVPSIDSRYKFYRELKSNGFKVGIRIQPFIPNVSTLEIAEMFHDADQFTLEGIKIVPQNIPSKEFVLNELGIKREDFTQMGLLNLKPEIRIEMYKPFIEFFNANNIPYSISDNDLRFLGNNNCCCGDRLIRKGTHFNTTAMIMKYGTGYSKQQVDNEILKGCVADCKVNQLFTSNRQEGCVTVQDFYDNRFDRKSSPFSPRFQYAPEVKKLEQCNINQWHQTNIYELIEE